MFQYTVARLLSENLNQKIMTSPPDFPFPENPSQNETDYGRTIVVDNNNLLEILDQKNIDANLHLTDYFQTKPFVLKYRQRIRDTINLKPERAEGIALQYRLGDLYVDDTRNNKVPGRWVQPGHYHYCLDRILEKHPDYPIVISSDISPESQHIIDEILNKYKNATLLQDTPANKIINLSRFTYKILSLGTYSFWCGILGTQENVYYPRKTDWCDWVGDILVYEDWHEVGKEEWDNSTAGR